MRHSWSLIWTTIRYLARKQKLVMFASWSIVNIWRSYCLLVLLITIWQLVVLETKTAKAATRDILTTHCIPSAVSEDLKSWGKLGAGCRLVQPEDPTILLGPGHLILLMNTSPVPREMLKEFHCRWDSACRRMEAVEYNLVAPKESLASITYTQKAYRL